MVSNIPIVPHRATISAIAKLAGVGTATVDRVLNDRAHVREATRQRVLRAKNAIETGSEVDHQARVWRIRIFLPEGAGPPTEHLAKCFESMSIAGRVNVECIFYAKLKPGALARRLRACYKQGIDAVGFQALDDPRVSQAVDELGHFGIPCVPILSGIVSPKLTGFIGIDNMSAGRTAGFLMGRLLSQPAQVAIISTGELYRVHTDREMGFRSVLRTDYRHLEIVETECGQDDRESNYQIVCDALHRYPDLGGIYNVGGGNSGVVQALKKDHHKDEIVCIGHNLTHRSAEYLLDGSMDIVLHQNLSRVADLAVQTLVAKLENREYEMALIPVEVITRENITGIAYG